MTRSRMVALAGVTLVCLLAVSLHPFLGGLLVLSGLFIVLFCALAAVIL